MIKQSVIKNDHEIPGGEKIDTKRIIRILDKYKQQTDGLIPLLEDIQAEYGYLPEKVLRKASDSTGRSLVDIYGVATFYSSFSLKPRGKHHISVCKGTACHVRSAPRIAEEFQRKLNIKDGQTTPDGQFTLDTVNCLGACAIGPVVVVDGHYFSNVKPSHVNKIIRQAGKGLDQMELKPNDRIFPLEVNCPHCNHSLMDGKHKVDDLPSIRMTISFNGQHCGFSLSCLYGSFNIQSQAEIPTDTIIHFFCPHCYAELASTSNCVRCNAPMVPMIVRKGGMIHVCSRRGCKEHRLDLNGVHV